MKEVQDRVVQFSNRYKLTNAETGEVLGTFDFDEVTGAVQQVGTEIDKELFDSIANDLAARVVSAGGELAGTIVTFSDISGTAANVASGETSATLWGKVKNWFSRLKALAFKNKVAAGDFEAGAIKNADVAADAAIAQSKINGLETALDEKANDANLAAIAKSGNLADATEDATHRVVTDTEKAAWNGKANTSGTYPNLTVGKATNTDNATAAKIIDNGFSMSNDASGWYHVCDIDVSSLDSDDAYDGVALLSFPSGENNALIRIVAPVEDIRNNQTTNVYLECFAGALTNGTYGFTVSNQAIQLYIASNENQSFTLTVLSEATHKKGRLKDSLVTATNDYSTAAPTGIVYGTIKNSAMYDNDHNYITETYVPVIAKSFTLKQQSQARENIRAASVAEMNAGDDKSYYNLGAYDTFTDNGDGTATITRKTGYLYGEPLVELGWSPENNYYRAPLNAVIARSNVWKYTNSYDDYNSTAEDAANYFSIDHSRKQIRINRGFAKNPSGGYDWETLAKNIYEQNVTVQYELETSYTEDVILDQPIHTLDVNGEQFVRNEWEKGLNLADWDGTEDYTKNQNTWTYLFIARLSVGVNYHLTIKNFSQNLRGHGGLFLVQSDTPNIPVRYQSLIRNPDQIVSWEYSPNADKTADFTPSKEYVCLGFDTDGTSKTLHVEDIMLVEGSHAYPYQPYNGKIVHEKELENYLPLSGGTIDGNLNVTEQLQENGLRVYSPNNPQTTIAHADNATNIIPNENGAVNPLGRKADSIVGANSTALGYYANASGKNSTALGYGATASDAASTALGWGATASAPSSTALGRGATASDSSSTALGLDATADGVFSTALGRGATALSNYSTALGDSANVPNTDLYTIQLGSSDISTLRCQVNLTVTSDERDKTDIEGITDALAFIERLNPVTFVSNDRVDYISDEDKKGETFCTYGMCEYDRIAHAAGTKKGERRRCGLLAQEVIAVMQEVYGTDNYANIVNDNFHDLAEKPSDVENKYTLAYANLVPFLIGAIKELNAKIKELEGETKV